MFWVSEGHLEQPWGAQASYFKIKSSHGLTNLVKSSLKSSHGLTNLVKSSLKSSHELTNLVKSSLKSSQRLTILVKSSLKSSHKLKNLVESSLKSSHMLKNLVKSSHDQVKSGQKFIKLSSQAAWGPLGCCGVFFSCPTAQEVTMSVGLFLATACYNLWTCDNFCQFQKLLKWQHSQYLWLFTGWYS